MKEGFPDVNKWKKSIILTTRIKQLHKMNASEAIANKLKARSLHKQVVMTGQQLLKCLDLQVKHL